MRLLITTQAVDTEDPALAFFVRWIAEFAGRVERVEVICLKKGKYALPENVRVYSLGKERGRPFLGSMAYAWRFLRLAWRLRRGYDAVFVHMNPEYVVLAGPLWRAWRKRVVLWYTHRQVNLKLRVAFLFANAVATAAPESLGMRSSKVHVVGHGIDVRMFESVRDGSFHEPLRLVSVGRITPIKRLEVLLDAVAALGEYGTSVRLTLVGAPAVPTDETYETALKIQARALGIENAVSFSGPVLYERMPGVYRDNDASINLAPTGGIDKAVLESMASGCIPLVANTAFRAVFKADAAVLVFEPDAEGLARKLQNLISSSSASRAALVKRLVSAAATEADVSVVVPRLLALYA